MVNGTVGGMGPTGESQLKGTSPSNPDTAIKLCGSSIYPGKTVTIPESNVEIQ